MIEPAQLLLVYTTHLKGCGTRSCHPASGCMHGHTSHGLVSLYMHLTCSMKSGSAAAAPCMSPTLMAGWSLRKCAASSANSVVRMHIMLHPASQPGRHECGLVCHFVWHSPSLDGGENHVWECQRISRATFESQPVSTCLYAGRIIAMRLLNSNKTPTQIAFVEFADADAAAAALDCSGSLLGVHLHLLLARCCDIVSPYACCISSLRNTSLMLTYDHASVMLLPGSQLIRVAPSKTPIRKLE